jgi:hypothetical protein
VSSIQKLPGPQGAPEAPQRNGFVPIEIGTQALLTHSSPDWHGPRSPQLCISKATSIGRHWLLSHHCPAVHSLLQLEVSDPLGKVVQTPATQSSPALQPLPVLPQLERSILRKAGVQKPLAQMLWSGHKGPVWRFERCLPRGRPWTYAFTHAVK